MDDKTLLISEIFPPAHGGSGRWFWELYTRLPRQDYVIAAGTTEQDKDFDRTHDLIIDRLNLFSESWGIKSIAGLKYYWRVFNAVRKIIITHNISRIHCGRCLPEGVIGFLLSKIYKIPYLCFIHGEDVETAATSRELSWMVRRVLYNANLLVGNSQNTKNLLIDNWLVDSKKVAVLNPGVDTNTFVPAKFNAKIREKLGWNKRPTILTVGRLQKRKGHDMMISALPEIKRRYADILYAIIGDGEEMSALKSLVEKLGLEENVQFLAEVSDQVMIECYQQCNLFILPNRTEGHDIEGFGMVLVEAQSCEKTVIAGDSGGTAETMIVGDTGYIVDCTDPTNISAKIVELISDEQKLIAMGKAGRKYVVNTLDWKAHSLRAKELFDQFL